MNADTDERAPDEAPGAVRRWLGVPMTGTETPSRVSDEPRSGGWPFGPEG